MHNVCAPYQAVSYTQIPTRGFVMSVSLLWGDSFHSVVSFLPGSDFLNFFFTR